MKVSLRFVHATRIAVALVACLAVQADASLALAQTPTVPKSSPGAPLDQLRATAQARMRRDAELFTRDQLREIEELYQSANQNLRAPESRGRLQQVLDKYPDSNRAGCAALYLAQTAPESDREALLKQAIDRHTDAWYGDGTQVGPLARAYLATLYQKQKRQDEAVAIARAILADTPDAVDHQGRRIVDVLRGARLLD